MLNVFTSLALGLLLAGCAHTPCLTGFSVGTTAGYVSAARNEYDGEYGEAYVELFYDTTGVCSAAE